MDTVAGVASNCAPDHRSTTIDIRRALPVFVAVTVVVDLVTIENQEIGAIADHVAMLAFSQAKAFERCREVYRDPPLEPPPDDDLA